VFSVGYSLFLGGVQGLGKIESLINSFSFLGLCTLNARFRPCFNHQV
jgi:hypothetical protein